MKVWYLPIESYTERYTGQLTGWTTSAFNRNGIEWVGLKGETLRTDQQISNPGPLDFKGRPFFSLTQMSTFIESFDKMAKGDVIYIDDMFTPGIETIPYLLDLHGLKDSVRVYARNHAGSCDIYDYVYPSKRWMRHYEAMVASFCQKIFCASSIHKELMDAQGIDNVSVVGLPFDANEVTDYQPLLPNKDRDKRVLFASRWDKEKNPMFFIDLAAYIKRLDPSVEFAVATGKRELMSNDPELVSQAYAAQSQGLIKIYSGLSKREYYRLVSSSAVQFNCASQDFVSYTMLEASAYNTPTVAPCYRSFPEAMFGRSEALYTPWDLKDAAEKVRMILRGEPCEYDITAAARFHHETLDRICQEFLNPGL